MKTVAFRQMKDGTKEDYELLDKYESQYIDDLPSRIILALERLNSSISGYQVTRLEHSLQTATRAQLDGADDEMVAAALLHDLGDELAPTNHGEFAASILRPYVREEVAWVVEHHGEFQKFYYGHHLGLNQNARDKYKEHPWYSSAEKFCHDWDQASFDPDFPTWPLERFIPLIKRVLSQKKV